MSDRTFDWMPDPDLEMAVRAALQTIRSHSAPSLYQLADARSEAGVNYVHDYAWHVADIPPQIIRDAGRRWVGERMDIANPRSFAEFTRQLQAERRGPVPPNTAHTEQLAVHARQRLKRATALQTRAMARLGDRRKVYLVWQLLVAEAAPESIDAIRDGQVSDDAFDDAVENVARGRRAPEPVAAQLPAVPAREWLSDARPPVVPSRRAVGA